MISLYDPIFVVKHLKICLYSLFLLVSKDLRNKKSRHSAVFLKQLKLLKGKSSPDKQIIGFNQ